MDGLTRRYGDAVAVDDVTLHVQRGAILGVIGPSGSGKTTLIRMLTGTLEPTSGSLSVLGEHPRKFKRSTRERLGYMPQHFVLYDELTASENLSFVASLFGLLWPKRGARVKRLLTLLELWDARNRRARQLSGGMQRRLELACAMVHDPVLLFLDEPTAGLDPIVANDFDQLIRDMQQSLGLTVFMVTHDLDTLFAICDRVAVLVDKQIRVATIAQHLRDNHPWIHAYFHGPRGRAALPAAMR
jgi:phospholipid/cholesterol/gamma-HCH transport system ATP-binding protein